MRPYQQLIAVADEIRQELQEAEEKAVKRGIEQGIEQGIEKGIRQGRKEGLTKGARAILTRLLTRRFGPLPGNATARIRRADRATLERWTDRILTARSLDDVLD